jgi:hypothetical protein
MMVFVFFEARGLFIACYTLVSGSCIPREHDSFPAGRSSSPRRSVSEACDSRPQVPLMCVVETVSPRLSLSHSQCF